MERLALFQIGIPGTAANATDALYANGNHQCKLVIRIIRQISDDGGTWQDAPLSATEKSSLVVLPCAGELRPQQAKGWYCDLEANQYQQGLWRRNASPDTTAASSATDPGTPPSAEQFYRYMRFNSSEASKQPAQFMASVTLDDGTQYSTQMDNGTATFASSVTISPQSCHVLSVQELTLSVQRAFAGVSGSAEVDTYYWTLPNGLRIIEERFSGEGQSTAQLVYAYSIRDGNKFRIGMAIRRGVTYLYLNQIDPYLWPQYNGGFAVTNSDSMLRAARYQCVAAYTNNNSHYDNSLFWTITDNFGCASTFILRANPADKGSTLQLLDVPRYLSNFHIGLVASGGSVTDALYANGRQQCKVFIKVQKEILRDGFSWGPALLSDSEKASITIRPYSNELMPNQAPGWSCDTEANQYDEGLWRGTGSVGLTGSSDTKAASKNIPADIIYRYMRFNGKQARIQPTRFMACITLDDGTKYSTHMQQEGEPEIESSIIITPQNPYSLRVNDLAHERQDAYNGPNSVDVDVNYWTLPAGLRIMEESFSGENSSSSKLVYVYYLTVSSNDLRRGMAIRCTVTSLNLNDISSSYANAEIPLINGDCLLRAARYSGGGSTTNYTSLTCWTIVDNYGCESRFVLDNNGDGNTLSLLNG